MRFAAAGRSSHILPTAQVLRSRFTTASIRGTANY